MSLDLGPLNAEGDIMSLLATEPLTLDEPWQALRTGEFVVVVDGQVVWQALDPDTRAFPVALPISEQRAPSPAG